MFSLHSREEPEITDRNLWNRKQKDGTEGGSMEVHEVVSILVSLLLNIS